MVERIFPIVAAYAVAVGVTAWGVWTWRWKANSGQHPLARWYHHHLLNQGWPYTNGAAIVPIVAGWGFLIGTALLLDLVLPPGSDYSALAFVVGAPLGLLTLWALIRPPHWMQPPWLAEAMRRRKAGLPSNVPVPPEGDRPVLGRRAYMLTIVAFLALSAVWLVLDLPIQHLLIGLGAGLPVLFATRVKR